VPASPARAPAAASPFARYRALGLGLALALAVFAVYARTLPYAFLWDDDSHVSANPRVTEPGGLRAIWTTAEANYFPLVLTHFRLQHALWGLDPAGYHAVTILCHALSALLLWRVLLALRLPGAWLGAALWALHPVQVESVAWICELKNTQSAIFFLAAIWCWLKWLEVAPVSDRRFAAPPATDAATEHRSETGATPGRSLAARARLAYLCALACAVCALLSKPSTVMLPVVLALLAWWRCGAPRLRDGIALAPFFALSAVAAAWTIWEQRHHSGALGAEWNQSLLERLAIAGKTTWFYLGKLAWPHPLTFIYPRWATTATAVDLAPALAAIAAFAGLAWLAWRRAAARSALLAAACFGALLFPVLGFFNVYFFRYAFVGDHFQYLASMAPLALLAAGLAALPRKIFLPVAAALLVAGGALSFRQCADYRDNETLWRATVARNPAAWMAWFNLGPVCVAAGKHADGIAAFRTGLALRPDNAPALNDLGAVLTLTGDPVAAERVLRRAIVMQPEFPIAHNNLGNALAALGRREEAIAAYAEAIRLARDYVEALDNLGAQLAETGQHAEAIRSFEAALRLRPLHAGVRGHLARALREHGLAFAAAGRWAEAIPELQRATRFAPRDTGAQAALAVALVNAGRLDEALPVFQAALALDPKSADLHENFSQLLGALGRKREAFAEMETAAALRRATPARRP
jgi:tetratricopeptide (TPR) repeat protein